MDSQPRFRHLEFKEASWFGGRMLLGEFAERILHKFMTFLSRLDSMQPFDETKIA